MNVKRRRSGTPQGKANQWVIKCQVVSPENKYTCCTNQTEQVILMKIYVYT